TLKEIVSSYSFSILGREGVHLLIPLVDRKEREERLGLVKEFKELLNSALTFPVPLDEDLRPILQRLKEGVYHLNIPELLMAGKITNDFKQVGKFLGKLHGKYSELAKIAGNISRLPDLNDKVQRVIDENGEIKDGASKELKSIRDGFRKLHKQLIRNAKKIISEKKKYLQDEIFTTRDGRIVIPVKFAEKKHIAGIVHGMSQTQNTIFIEPLEMVELNNEYATFRLREEREIKRILRLITEVLIDHFEHYERSIEEMKRIDMLYAIASFSDSYGFSEPHFSMDSLLSIRGGKHPLLVVKKGEDAVVPFDVDLGRETKLLLISGPNMGGKTVLLKSIGIIILMAYTGLFIPTKNDSVIPEIDSIFADIGDEQSIAMDLSTFSSHIRHISTALQQSTDKSLVLLDEIGVGTDPAEGMGIAMVALERLAEKGVLTFATTHYGKLKFFVAGNSRMENGSMQFDEEHSTPTYHLSMGIPGSSHGFAIAEKVGFPPDLIQKAKTYVDQNEIKTDELICSLEMMQRETDEKIKTVEREKSNLAALIEKYEQKYQKLVSTEKEFIVDAKRHAEEIVLSTRREMEHIVKEIRESQASKKYIKKAKALIETNLQVFEEKKEERNGQLAVGDYVYSKRLKIKGEVTELLDNYVRVKAENFHFVAPYETLELAENDRKQEPREAAETVTRDTSSEIHLRGLLADEAVMRVTKFIDDAVLSGLSTIYIIHGKGSGVLREAVSELLKHDERIKEYRLGHWDEGGSGVTVVQMKS
ncbi:MAG: endonuclease MutS2, partial [Candidatus Cloacimonadota bacterium]